MTQALAKLDNIVMTNDITAIVTEVKALSITTPETYREASELMIRIRKIRKAQEEDLKKRLKPWKDKIKTETERTDIGLTLLKNSEAQLQSGILAYQRKAKEEAEREQAKQIKAFEKKVERAEAKAEATGQPVPLIVPPAIIQAPSTQVKSDSGSMHTTAVKKWRIKLASGAYLFPDQAAGLKRDDPRMKEIPDCFFGLVTADITKLVKAIGEPGKPTPGCPGIEVYEDFTLNVK